MTFSLVLMNVIVHYLFFKLIFPISKSTRDFYKNTYSMGLFPILIGYDSIIGLMFNINPFDLIFLTLLILNDWRVFVLASISGCSLYVLVVFFRAGSIFLMGIIIVWMCLRKLIGNNERVTNPIQQSSSYQNPSSNPTVQTISNNESHSNRNAAQNQSTQSTTDSVRQRVGNFVHQSQSVTNQSQHTPNQPIIDNRTIHQQNTNRQAVEIQRKDTRINTQPVKYEAPPTITEPRASSLSVQPTRLAYEQLNMTYPQVKKEEIPTSAVSSQPVVTAVDFSIVKDEYNHNYQVDQNKLKRKAEDDDSFEEPPAKKNK